MRVGSSLSIRKKVDVIPVVSLPTRVVISYLQALELECLCSILVLSLTGLVTLNKSLNHLGP